MMPLFYFILVFGLISDASHLYCTIVARVSSQSRVLSHIF